jgi:hypothetical protein
MRFDAFDSEVRITIGGSAPGGDALHSRAIVAENQVRTIRTTAGCRTF